MSHIYDEELQDMIRQSAKHLEIDLKEGVYIQLAGPNFESPAEIRMCKIIGADSLAYLKPERLKEMAGGLPICTACFTGDYPVAPPKEDIRGAYDK